MKILTLQLLAFACIGFIQVNRNPAPDFRLPITFRSVRDAITGTIKQISRMLRSDIW